MQELIIQTKDLTKIYGEQTVVDRVNIHIRQGKIYGLLGRNGAGKTTIMKMMMGLTRITKGEIEIFGQRVETHQKDIYPRIGAIIEAPGFYPNLTGAENLNVFARLRGTVSLDAVNEALELVGLPYNDKKLFSKYSLGMKPVSYTHLDVYKRQQAESKRDPENVGNHELCGCFTYLGVLFSSIENCQEENGHFNQGCAP